MKPQVNQHEFNGTPNFGSTRLSQLDAGNPSSRANANACREVLAKHDVPIISKRTSMTAMMPVCPAMLNDDVDST